MQSGDTPRRESDEYTCTLATNGTTHGSLFPACRFTSLPSDPQSFLTDWWKGGSYRACKHALVGFTALLQRELGPAGMVGAGVFAGAGVPLGSIAVAA